MATSSIEKIFRLLFKTDQAEKNAVALREKVISLSGSVHTLTRRMKEFGAYKWEAEIIQQLSRFNQEATVVTRSRRKMTEEEKLAQKIAKLTDTIIRSENGSLEQLNAQIKLNTLAWNRLSREQREGTSKGRALTAELRRQREEVRQLTLSAGDYSRNVGNYTSVWGKIGGLISSVKGYWFVAATVIRSLLTPFKDFEYAMAKVQAVSGATDAEIQQLTTDARALGAATEYTATQVAELQLEYSRIGFSPKEILDATGATLDLATATGEDLARSADVAGSTLRAFGLDAREMRRVVDVMAASFNKSSLQLDNFAESMKYVAPIAKNAGVSIEQTTAMLGILADRGIRGSQAGTALRRILTEISISGKTVSEALSDLNEKGLTVAGAMDEVGRYAMTALSVLVDNAPKVGVLTEVLEESSGAAKNAAAIMRDNLKGDLDQALSAIQEKAIAWGQAISGVLREVVQAFTLLVRNLGAVAMAVPAYVAAKVLLTRHTKLSAVATVAETSAIRAQIVALKSASAATRLIAAAKFLLTGKIKAATLAIRLFGAAIKANPIGWIATGVALAASTLTGLISKLTGAKAATKALTETQSELFAAQTNANVIFEALKKSNEGSREHADLLGIIKERYGEYLQDLIDESGNLTDVEEAQRRVNDELERSIVLKMKNQAKESVIEEFTKKQIDGLETLRRQLQRVVGKENVEIVIKQMSAAYEEGGEQLSRNLMALCDRFGMKYNRWLARFYHNYGAQFQAMNKELAEIDTKFGTFGSASNATTYPTGNTLPEVTVSPSESDTRILLAKKTSVELQRIADEAQDEGLKKLAQSILKGREQAERAAEEAKRRVKEEVNSRIAMMQEGMDKDLAIQNQKYKEEQEKYKGNSELLQQLAAWNDQQMDKIKSEWHGKELNAQRDQQKQMLDLMDDGYAKEMIQLRLHLSEKIKEAKGNAQALLLIKEWNFKEEQRLRDKYNVRGDATPQNELKVNTGVVGISELATSQSTRDFVSARTKSPSAYQQQESDVYGKLSSLEQTRDIDLAIINASGAAEEQKQQRRIELEKNYQTELYNTHRAFLENVKSQGLISDEAYQRQIEGLAGIADKIRSLGSSENQGEGGSNKDSWLAKTLGLSETETEQVKQQSIDLAQQIGQSVISIQTDISQRRLANEKSRIDAERDAELKSLEIKRTKGVISEKKYNKLVAKANAEADKKKEEAERAAFEREKKLKLLGIAMDVAAGIVRIWSQAGLSVTKAIIQTAILTATGIVQTAAIASQKYARGGIVPIGNQGDGIRMAQLKGASHAQGGIPLTVNGSPIGEVEGDEVLAVINKRSSRKYLPLLSRINQAEGGRKFASGGLLSSPRWQIPSPASLPVTGEAAYAKYFTQQINALRIEAQKNNEQVHQRIDTLKVVVVESDITESQKAVKRTQVRNEF